MRRRSNRYPKDPKSVDRRNLSMVLKNRSITPFMGRIDRFYVIYRIWEKSTDYASAWRNRRLERNFIPKCNRLEIIRSDLWLCQQKQNISRIKKLHRYAMLLQCPTNKFFPSHSLTYALPFIVPSLPDSESVTYIIVLSHGSELLDLGCHATQLTKECIKSVQQPLVPFVWRCKKYNYPKGWAAIVHVSWSLWQASQDRIDVMLQVFCRSWHWSQAIGR